MKPLVKFRACISDPPELPQYQTSGAAGMDIRSAESIVLEARGGRAVVSTGYEVEVSPGHEGQVRSRSGLAAKHGVSVLNAPGTIDEDYRGELKVILINQGDSEFVINKGDRIAQMVVSPVVQAKIELVDSLTETDRGVKGFGSTGV